MRCWIALAVAAFAISVPLSAQTGKVQYARDVLPILATHCFHCHGPDAAKAGLRLDVGETATKILKSGNRAVSPGKVKDSELIARIFAADDAERMPPKNAKTTLKDSEKALLKRWIAEGAEYQRHWAFVAPKRPALPPIKGRANWSRNPIDRFVLARMEKHGLTPSPEADRYTLARRLAIDLTGLPPTIDLADRFVNDKSPDAYEKYVDQLMTLPAYGERWAHVWLDLARYADSNGYATDSARTIFKYRDWVIDALNKNMPYDRFTIEQIAGDLLPNATNEQILATAFHRNTLTNDEGGTSDEEFRCVAVVDRVNTTLQVWMGLTMACAQCHNHKYDPISQEEYFRLYAIFNQTQDSDKSDNSPNLIVISPQDEKRKAELETTIAGLEKQLLQANPKLDEAQAKWQLDQAATAKAPAAIKKILALDPKKRGVAQKLEITKYYRSTLPELKSIAGPLAAARKQYDAVKGVPTPIMRELPEKQKRVTKIHLRGNFLDQGKLVGPGLPAFLHALPKGQAANRLALANWLVAPENPLTARVAVNRYWEQIFGLPLMESPDDFGIRGKMPTHPELLDWLAVEFSSSPLPSAGEGPGVRGWDVKRLLKLIVTSAAYRQSSLVTPALMERDPENRWLSRGPRFRSSAEVIRDQSLYVAGLLSPKMYGPPVRPPRPKLGLNAAFGPTTDWETSAGEDKYRRALYTQWRRTTPYPSMTTFDAPSRTVCTVTRPRTNTPLQALVTLNDPVYVEAAQALGRRIAAFPSPSGRGVKGEGATLEAKLQFGFRLCLTRPARDIELKRLTELYTKAAAEYAKNPKAATQMATEPIGPLPAGMQAPEMAAWTVVGNVLLNLDETLVKR